MATSPFDVNAMKVRCQCEDCGLYRSRQHPYITGRMADHSTDLSKVKFIVIGEAPGKHEDEKGYCFAGFSGENLEKAFGEDFQYVYLTNICRCLPLDEKNPGKVRQPTLQEMQACGSWIVSEISLFPSDIPIILCGNTAFSYFFPEGKGITNEAGIPRTKNIRSSSRVFIPNFHPAAIGYNPKYSKQFYDIFVQVRSGISFEYQADPNTKILHPSDGINYLSKVISLYEKKVIKYCVYDSETTSLSPNAGNMIMLGFCDPYTKKGVTIPTHIQNTVHPEWKGATIPIDMTISENDIVKLQMKTREFFAKVPIVGHNLKFDIQFASFHQYMNINRVSVYNDTLAMMSVLIGREWEGDSLSLKESAHRVCGVDLWEGEIEQYLGLYRLVVDKHFGNIPTCILYKYCGRDVYYNMILHDALENRIPEQKCEMVIHNMNRLTEVFSKSELAGIEIDLEVYNLMKETSGDVLLKLDRDIKKDPKIKAIMKNRYDMEVEANSKKFYKSGKPMRSWKDPATLKQKLLDGEYFSVTSPIDKKEFLKAYNIAPIIKTEKGDTAVTREALEIIADHYSDNVNVVRFCTLLQQYSKFSKLKTTYIDGLYELVWDFDKRYHANFSLFGTRTGRMCLIEGTKIATVDKGDRLINSFKIGETFKVYSYDLKNKQRVISDAHALGNTRIDSNAVKITLDNGKQEICTVDHLWLMRNGTYKEAFYLEIDDCLMPVFDQFYDKKYEYKIVNVENISFDTPQNFYDIEVPEYHNFALSCGVFVHNSSGFHTMPRQSSVKRLFKSRWADQGGLFSGSDMSQLELRVTAAISGEPSWIQAYIDNKDLHQLTASNMFGIPFDEVSKEQRTMGKSQNFSLLYQQGAESQAKKLGITKEEAEKALELYKKTIPRIMQLTERQKEIAINYGYITTMFNRRIPTPDAQSTKKVIKNHGLRQSLNFLIQSSSSDVVLSGLVSMIKEMKERKMRTILIGAVHDSVEFDIYPGEAIQFYNMIKYHFETYLAKTFKWLKCPMRIDMDMGTSWGSCLEMENPEMTEDYISFESAGFKNDVLKLADQARKAYNFDYEITKVKELSDKDFTIIDLVKDTEKWEFKATISTKK